MYNTKPLYATAYILPPVTGLYHCQNRQKGLLDSVSKKQLMSTLIELMSTLKQLMYTEIPLGTNFCIHKLFNYFATSPKCHFLPKKHQFWQKKGNILGKFKTCSLTLHNTIKRQLMSTLIQLMYTERQLMSALIRLMYTEIKKLDPDYNFSLHKTINVDINSINVYRNTTWNEFLSTLIQLMSTLIRQSRLYKNRVEYNIYIIYTYVYYLFTTFIM